MAYDYDIVYRRTSDHGNADFCSRMPKDIAQETKKDPVLSKIYMFAQNGWPDVPSEKSEDEFKPYFRIRNEISCDQGCLLWGMRVIIPPKFRVTLVRELHHEHLGIVRTKALARSYFWFPKLDEKIEDMVKSCSVCQTLKADLLLSPLYPWRYTDKPWSRLHADFGEYRQKHYLVVVDSYSKWPEVVKMNTTTAEKTIEAFRSIFCIQGIPEKLVTDNGPPYTSEEFERFCASNGIEHILSPPYHPATNGQAENAVKTVKNALKKHFLDDERSGLSDSHKLANFLLTYRCTPHSVTGVTPAELLNKRKLRTRWDLLRPDMRKSVEKKQQKQKEHHDVRVHFRDFEKNEIVRVKNSRDNKEVKFVLGTILRRLGPLRYLVDVAGNARFVHADHMRKTSEGESSDSRQVPNFHGYDRYQVLSDLATSEGLNDSSSQETVETFNSAAVVPPPELQTPKPKAVTAKPVENRDIGIMRDSHPDATNTPVRRYPVRDRKPSVKLKDYVTV
ncbi:PREDICTED: uncharacterized protein K02A2.6-like [Priapulus caudatus]|uniref:RNA-directed DNA polymerase n=1 Tax=Priapulus caudatus TaxID=37621 RepID=A0ABM1F3M6_PRICU|nr:PREDICTED: uncharacterized protein K02A2.6-like [Priapulus caudatus]